MINSQGTRSPSQVHSVPPFLKVSFGGASALLGRDGRAASLDAQRTFVGHSQHGSLDYKKMDSL